MGCVMSTALACMLCNHKCSVSEMAAQFSFFPPNPPSYSVESGTDGSHTVHFAHPEMREAARWLQQSVVRFTPHMLYTSRGSCIAMFHFCYPQAQRTIIWSHGNAMDIGEMYFFFFQVRGLLSRARNTCVSEC